MGNPRRLALDSLKKCARDGKYVNLEVLSSLSDTRLEARDKALYTALVYGVIEKSITLDYLISGFSRLPLERLDSDTLNALRLGLYQIIYMDRIPGFSACDEAVKLVPRSAKPYVNAVLRSALRCDLNEKIRCAPLSVRYSVPDWLIELWQKGYGEEKTLEILEGFLKRPPMTIIVNTLKTNNGELLGRIDAQPHPELDGILFAKGNVEELYGFDKGFFFVQGSNSYRAVRALAPSSDELVIDTCACPGGKSFTSAILMGNKGKIYSFDLHASKLSLINKGAERLGIDIIETAVSDARAPRAELVGRADAVICDVPCSGLGIIAKKPDIKYKSPNDIERLPEIQFDILTASSEYLRVGGRLLYSTCTLNPDENERVVDKFLAVHPEFRSVERKTAFPSDESDDGFFYELLIKDS